MKQNVKTTRPEVSLQVTKNYCHGQDSKVGICLRAKQHIFVFYYQANDVLFFDRFECNEDQIITGVGKIYDDELYLVNIILIDSTNYVMAALSYWYNIDIKNLFESEDFDDAALEIRSEFFAYFRTDAEDNPLLT